jgi:nicotinate phosphoribosyltransferase
MGYLADLYTLEQTSPTMTDRYHFTTGFGYWLEGRFMNKAVANVFARKEAEGGGYTIEAGIEAIIDTVKRWKDYGLTAEDKTWLHDEGYPQDYIDYIHDALINDCPLQIDVSKKRVFLPQEPTVRLIGPIGIIKMLESVNLCHENGQNAYATHGARMTDTLNVEVESGAPKGLASTQGLRRGPSLGAAIEASRGLAIGGYSSTSTGRAAQMLGLTFAGTMDHAWVQTHIYQLNKEPDAPTMRDLFIMEKEERFDDLREALKDDAFRSYAYANRKKGILLADTYDTPEGIEDAITVIEELRECAIEFNEPDWGKYYGMRFDSGDLTEFSKMALRRIAERNKKGLLLDALPDDVDVSSLSDKDLLKYAKSSSAAPFCAASDGINVYSAQKMRADGAYIAYWGVGTAGSHPPPLGMVQKISAMDMEVRVWDSTPDDAELTPTMKINRANPSKSSNPGLFNSRRFYGEDGKLSHLVIFDENQGFDDDQQIVDLRDFSNVITNPGGAKSEDMLEPVFDAKGRYVYNEPPKKPLHPGSSHMITDLEQMAAQVQAELDELPDSVREVRRPQEDVLKELLFKHFEAASQNGDKEFTVDIDSLKDQLPEPQEHIPVYLDMNLFRLRELCLERHGITNDNNEGISADVERFDAAIA